MERLVAQFVEFPRLTWNRVGAETLTSPERFLALRKNDWCGELFGRTVWKVSNAGLPGWISVCTGPPEKTTPPRGICKAAACGEAMRNAPETVPFPVPASRM